VLKVATLQQIKDAVDAKLTAIWPTVVAKQNTYFTNHGQYFQGLLIPRASVPADGNSVAVSASDLSQTPYYQTDSWGSFIAGLPTTLPMTLQCDQYCSVAGFGWQVTLTVMVLGNTYQRVWDSQGTMTLPWFQVPSG
jgi:hypothetical protein